MKNVLLITIFFLTCSATIADELTIPAPVCKKARECVERSSDCLYPGPGYYRGFSLKLNITHNCVTYKGEIIQLSETKREWISSGAGDLKHCEEYKQGFLQVFDLCRD